VANRPALLFAAGGRSGNDMCCHTWKKSAILCLSSNATLDIERPALLVEESTGLILTTSLQDVPPTDETIICGSGTLGKAF